MRADAGSSICAWRMNLQESSRWFSAPASPQSCFPENTRMAARARCADRGPRTSMNLRIKTLIAGLALAATGLASAQQTLLNVSYDVAREFYKDINAAFVPYYKKQTGKDVKVEQSHAGSSAQARAVADGLDADVVTMNTTTDIEFLAERGVVAKDWEKRFTDNEDTTTSKMLILVRNGNPQDI